VLLLLLKRKERHEAPVRRQLRFVGGGALCMGDTFTAGPRLLGE
jgi:hypothetical protein